jgi:hypothetical protein
VISVFPEQGSLLDAPPEKVEFRFSERISERSSEGDLNSAVEISPMTGEVRVRHRRDRLEVTLEGGFQPDQVYRVRVRPLVQDMFQNTLRAPFETVFSTGPELGSTVLAGTAVDRLTLQSVQPTRVNAESMEGGSAPVHTALADTGGVFVLRYIPPGLYRVVAFNDVNRDRQVDPFESQASALTTLGVADTAFLTFRTLVPDTSAAILARAEVGDSARMSLTFDDFLDPEWVPNLVKVLLADSVGDPPPEGVPQPPDSLDPLPLPEVVQVVHPFLVDSVLQVRRDSLDAEAREVALEEALASGDSVAIELAQAAIRAAAEMAARRAEERAEQEARGEPGGGAPAEPLPENRLEVILDRILPPGRLVRVEVTDVRNISGLSGGGGVVGLSVPVPAVAEADTAATDTLAADSLLADTLAVDTLAVDTLAVDTLIPGPPATDTLAPDPLGGDSAAAPDTVPADTLSAPAVVPDTVRPDTVPPDTLRRVILRPRR